MTRTVARLVMVSHITSRLLKYFRTSQTTRTRLFNQCTRVAAIIQSSDLRDGQSNFIHSRRTKKSKTLLFNKWVHSSKYEDLTEAFQKLSRLPSQETITECLPILYHFLESAFGRGYGGSLDEFRLKTFKSSSSNNLHDLPPSRSGLELHVRQASYQAGCVWGI